MKLPSAPAGSTAAGLRPLWRRPKRKGQFTIGAVLTLGIAALLCALSRPIFQLWPDTMRTIFALPVYGGALWLIAAALFSALVYVFESRY